MTVKKVEVKKLDLDKLVNDFFKKQSRRSHFCISITKATPFPTFA